MCGLNELIHAKSLAQCLAHAEYSGRFPCSGAAPSGGPFTARSPLASELVHLCCGPEHILVIFLVLVEGQLSHLQGTLQASLAAGLSCWASLQAHCTVPGSSGEPLHLLSWTA